MLAYRPADDRDRRFIVDAWVSSFRTAHSAGMIAMEDWRAVMWPQVEKMLERPDVISTVAYETDDKDRLADLYGFIAADVEMSPPLILYVYVKEAYRKTGIARGLFKSIGVDPSKPFHYACKTHIVRTVERKIPMAKWQPLLARFPKTDARTKAR